MTTTTKLQGKIVKKCDTAGHRPESNKGCAAGTCQHTCQDIERCSHAWTLRYSVAGKQTEESFTDEMDGRKRVRYGTGLKKAQDAQLELNRGKRAEGHTYVAPTAGKENFGEACLKFVDAIENVNTRTNYRTVYTKWVAPEMGRMSLAQAARAHDTVEGIMSKMGKLTASRRRVARLLVVGVLNKAVARKLISGHTIVEIQTGTDSTAREEFVFPTFNQVAYLAANIGIVIWLMRGCGLRIAEALAVEKSDFRNGGKTLRVSGQASRDGLRKMPLKHRKEGEYRDAPVPSWLWKMVKDLPGGPLCPGTGPRKYMLYSTVNAQFVKFVPRAGIQGRFTAHSLRHLFASVMLGEGVQITDVAKWLGHRSINVTYAIYGHLLPDADDKAIAALDGEYERWTKAA